MKITEAVDSKIKKLCKERGYTVYAFSQKSGIPESTINSIKGHKDCTLLTILTICSAFDMSLAEFFDDELFDAGIIELPN